MGTKLKSLCKMRSTNVIKCVWVIRQGPILDPKRVGKKVELPQPLTIKWNALPKHSDWCQWLLKEEYYVYNSLCQRRKSRDVSLHLKDYRSLCQDSLTCKVNINLVHHDYW